MQSLKSILANLPAPLAAFAATGVGFEVYRARALGRGPWENETVRNALTLARSSYYRYGRRPLFDPYDGKAAIYLVRAQYAVPQISDVCEEWLSIRMVPGDGKPLGVGEPEMFLSGGKPVHALMKKKIGARGFWNHVASSSRMCGIHPYRAGPRGNISYLSEAKHRFTPVSFALAHAQFRSDYPVSRYPYRYITATLRPDFQVKGLGYRVGGRSVHMTFTPAYRFLGSSKRELHADRWIYSYAFPLYWMDLPGLRKFVNRLRKNAGKPPVSALRATMFSHLESRIERPISIAGVWLLPSAARAIIDNQVVDSPELKITKAGDWYAGIDKLLAAAKVTRVPKRES
jgi:hypothetical protein